MRQRRRCFLVGAVGSHDPGLIWATTADTKRILTATAGPLAYFLNLKLKDAAAASAFAHRRNTPESALSFLSWQEIRNGDAQTLAKVRLILVTGSWLLALLAIASVTVLVGGRMAEHTRRVGLLKAVGATPRLVAIVLLSEHVLLALGAAGMGLLVGWLTAPMIDSPGAGLLGASSAPAMSAATIVLVAAMALGVAIVATFVPSALRAARQSTVSALEDSARPPQRRAMLIGISAHLPAPLLLGARIAGRRPRRLLLSIFSVAVTSSGFVAVLVLRASVPTSSAGPELTRAATVISVMLLMLAAVNAAFISWTTAIEVRHPAALARALGATPRQFTAGLTTAYAIPASIGAFLGILGGIAIYSAAKHGGGATTLPSISSLTAMVILTVAAIAVLTAIPTHIAARRPVAEVLQAERA